jgi:hypothetical protein
MAVKSIFAKFVTNLSFLFSSPNSPVPTVTRTVITAATITSPHDRNHPRRLVEHQVNWPGGRSRKGYQCSIAKLRWPDIAGAPSIC